MTLTAHAPIGNEDIRARLRRPATGPASWRPDADVPGMIRVEDLRVDDIVDLEGDLYADPHANDPALANEYVRVVEIIPESESCLHILFDVGGVAFPVGHQVRLSDEHQRPRS